MILRRDPMKRVQANLRKLIAGGTVNRLAVLEDYTFLLSLVTLLSELAETRLEDIR